MSGITIGHLAKQTNVSVETIRFYEKQGLLAKPTRTASGYRQYTPDVVRRVMFIQRAKELGFSLKEIADLLNLRRTTTIGCADINRVALSKITSIDQKILQLQQMRSALQTLAMQCEANAPLSDCPILDALESAQ